MRTWIKLMCFMNYDNLLCFATRKSDSAAELQLLSTAPPPHPFKSMRTNKIMKYECLWWRKIYALLLGECRDLRAPPLLVRRRLTSSCPLWVTANFLWHSAAAPTTTSPVHSLCQQIILRLSLSSFYNQWLFFGSFFLSIHWLSLRAATVVLNSGTKHLIVTPGYVLLSSIDSGWICDKHLLYNAWPEHWMTKNANTVLL